MNSADKGKMTYHFTTTNNLRDEFAMAALTGLLASNEFARLYSRARTAEEAYRLADAMMEARDK